VIPEDHRIGSESRILKVMSDYILEVSATSHELSLLLFQKKACR
jgi:hypothetical protein